MERKKYIEYIEIWKQENKELIENGKCRKVFLECLPRWENGTNEGKICWINSAKLYKEIYFIYDKIEGWIKIIKHISGKKSLVDIEYNNEEFCIQTSMLLRCNLEKILKNKIRNYYFEVDQIIDNNRSSIIILEKILIKNNKNWNIKAYKYKCLTDGYIGEITEEHLKENKGCPVCCNRKILKGYNDIATTHPDLVKYFKNIEDSYTHSYGSSAETILFKCPDCGFEKEMTIKDLYQRGFGCPKCGDGISLANKIMFNILEQFYMEFKTEFNPEWCQYLFKEKLKKGKYDFYFELNKKKYILEMDGEFHNKDNKMNGQTAEESKFIDDEKDRLAMEHGIEVIRIDCNPSEFNYIKQNILNDKVLNIIFDLSKINWTKVEEYTLTSKLKLVCNLWNEGLRSPKEIGKIIKSSPDTVSRYLNKGNEFNLCTFSPQDIYINRMEKLSYTNKLRAKEIINIETGQIFESASECARQSLKVFGVKLLSGSISAVCNRKIKYHHSFHFKFTKDLTEEQIKEIQENAKINQAI